jgi:hypothetical protein
MPDTEQLLKWRVFTFEFEPYRHKRVLTASR